MMKSLVAVSGLATAGMALAHPGHDHSSWTAPLLHALWLAPVAIALVAGVYVVRKMLNK